MWGVNIQLNHIWGSLMCKTEFNNPCAREAWEGNCNTVNLHMRIATGTNDWLCVYPEYPLPPCDWLKTVTKLDTVTSSI